MAAEHAIDAKAPVAPVHDLGLNALAKKHGLEKAVPFPPVFYVLPWHSYDSTGQSWPFAGMPCFVTPMSGNALVAIISIAELLDSCEHSSFWAALANVQTLPENTPIISMTNLSTIFVPFGKVPVVVCRKPKGTRLSSTPVRQDHGALLVQYFFDQPGASVTDAVKVDMQSRIAINVSKCGYKEVHAKMTEYQNSLKTWQVEAHKLATAQTPKNDDD